MGAVRYVLGLLALLIASAISPACVQAAWSDPAPLADGAAPRIDVSSGGTAVAAMIRNSDGRVIAAVRPPGAAWGPFEELSPAGVTVTGLDIAIDESSRATAIWGESGAGLRSSDRPAGGSWGSAETVRDTGTAERVNLDVNGAGAAVAGWYESGNPARAWAGARDPGGSWTATTLGPGGRVGLNTEVGIDADGNAVAVWSSYQGSPSPGTAYVETSARPAAGAWSSSQELASSAGLFITGDVAVAADGAATAVWWEDPATGVDRILSFTRTAGTGAWGAGVPMSGTTEDAALPSVARNETGKSAVVWTQQVAENEYVHRVASRDSDAAAWTAPDLLASGGGQSAPTIALAALGDLTALADSTEAGSSGTQLTAGQGTVGSLMIDTLTTGPGDTREADVGLDNQGIALAVWEKGGSSFYANSGVAGPECSDGVDNDSDGKTDHPSDPGCASVTDDSESPDPPPGGGGGTGGGGGSGSGGAGSNTPRPVQGGQAPPTLGVNVNVGRVSGVVLVGIPSVAARAAGVRTSQKGVRFVPLTQARQIPVGSFLDTRRGVVRLSSARNTAGAAQTGDFGRGLFQVLQSRKRSAKGLTDLRAEGAPASAPVASATRGSARHSRCRAHDPPRLRSNAGGRFRTRGRHSAATVRGTKWETIDRCDGTLTKVTRGSVTVRDFRRKKSLIVKAGKSYLARARR